MNVVNELFLKLPAWLKGTSQDETPHDLFQTLAEANAIKLDSYYAIWQKKLREAARLNKVLSNGWAFSTLSGLSLFETHIRSSDFRAIYFNRPVEVTRCLDTISERLHGRPIGGMIFYGYGNLIRESQFIEYAKQSRLLSNQRVYLIDCSLFYHILANSPLNPMRNLLKTGQMRVSLLDYLEDNSANESLQSMRADLNPMRPVLHMFLGNTFCNTEAPNLKHTLDLTVRAGDFVVGEYAKYSADYFTNIDEDYVTNMARLSTAELFSLPPDAVTAKNIMLTSESIATQVEFADSGSKERIRFISMIRRNFHHSELTEKTFELLDSLHQLDGRLRLDTFVRLASSD